ncbi:galanin receptor type 1-like [Montipora foliosa]|uniref:galanin receptor type 1-like n=1 Tax=Montipora foliosa TaxID=591990 RepID=UPI0035F12081
MEQNTNFSSTNGSEFTSNEHSKMAVEEALQLTFQVLIAAFGVVGNALVVTVLTTAKKTQAGEFYLMNLAIADLGTLLLTFPIVAIKQKAFSWPLGGFFCLYLSPAAEMFHGASVWFLAVIAIERYCQVVTVKVRLKCKNKTSMQRAKVIGGCVWVTSFLIFSIPIYFIMDYHEKVDGTKVCKPNWPSPMKFGKTYVVALTAFSYLLPLSVISFTYFVISRALARSNAFIIAMKMDQLRQGEKKPLTITSSRLQQNNRAKRILTPLVLVFALTMLPLNALRLITVFGPEIVSSRNIYKILFFVAAILAILNSSVNPVIYSVVSTDFRRRVSNLFSRRKGLPQKTLLGN